MTVNDFFPEILVNNQPKMGEDFVSLEKDGRYYHFPLSQLTDRERRLLELFQEETNLPLVADPWYRYLVLAETGLPLKIDSCQLVYLEHATELPADLLDLYRQLLPNLVASSRLSQTRTLLVLDQAQRIDVAELLEDTLQTIEHDFGLRLTIFFGNIWSRLQQNDLRLYFQGENHLFTSYVSQKGSEPTVNFSRLLLWGQSQQLDVSVFTCKFGQWMDEIKDMRDVVRLLWETHGNLVQTAQRLFMHRNSLQYKLDKFTGVTGLNLKNLDDLAICYLLLLQT